MTDDQPLVRDFSCVLFTREVPIAPLVRATRTHIQRTASAVLRAKTHQRQGPPYQKADLRLGPNHFTWPQDGWC
jgi:hypothetical protein